MKFLIVFALALAAASAAEIYPRELYAPTLDIEGRITNGHTASAGQFPYQVGLSLRLSALSSSWCGGSLIGNKWVLTAAHCTEGVSSVTVYLGATVRTSAEVTHTVSSSDIIIHSDWSSSTLRNDISLIKIPSTTYTTRIQAVKLPAIASSYSTYVGHAVTASGWGRTSDSSSSVATDLKYAQFKVSADSVCTSVFGSSVFTSSNVCVGTSDGVSTCQGDSGGPLVLDASKVQIGLTSYGAAAGCEKNYPVVFTRVTSYLSWIKEKTDISY